MYPLEADTATPQPLTRLKRQRLEVALVTASVHLPLLEICWAQALAVQAAADTGTPQTLTRLKRQRLEVATMLETQQCPQMKKS